MLLVHQEYGRIVKSLKLMETRNIQFTQNSIIVKLALRILCVSKFSTNFKSY